MDGGATGIKVGVVDAVGSKDQPSVANCDPIIGKVVDRPPCPTHPSAPPRACPPVQSSRVESPGELVGCRDASGLFAFHVRAGKLRAAVNCTHRRGDMGRIAGA